MTVIDTNQQILKSVPYTEALGQLTEKQPFPKFLCSMLILKKAWQFPGGPVVRTSTAKGLGFKLWSGR